MNKKIPNINTLIKKGRTGKYDKILSIDKLEDTEENIDMYTEYEKDYIENELAPLIASRGLENPIVLFKDGKSIKYGHNRKRVLRFLGYVEAPVVISETPKPKSKLETAKSLAVGNQGRKADMARSYKAVKYMKKLYEEENKGMSPNTFEIKEYCILHQLGFKSYTKLVELETLYPDLFDNVISGASSLNSAILDMNYRKKYGNIQLKKTPFMKGLIGVDEVKTAVAMLAVVQNQINNITLMTPGGKKVKAFEDIQQNTMGAIVHEIFTNAIRDVINHNKNDEILTAPKNQSLYDLEALKHQSGIETKTCVTETGKKPKFVTHRYKDGYHVLLSVTPNGNRMFAGYGVIPGDCWKKSQTVGTLDIAKLYSEAKEFNILIGSIEEEKEKIVVHHEAMEI